jgi:hypothetical protein
MSAKVRRLRTNQLQRKRFLYLLQLRINRFKPRRRIYPLQIRFPCVCLSARLPVQATIVRKPHQMPFPFVAFNNFKSFRLKFDIIEAIRFVPVKLQTSLYNIFMLHIKQILCIRSEQIHLKHEHIYRYFH